MPVIDKSVPETTKCSCGRFAKFIHCPACGSTNLNGRKRPVRHEEIAAQRDGAKLWTCRRCAYLFSDHDRAHCDAPMEKFSVAQQRAQASAESALRGVLPNDTPPDGETLKRLGLDKYVKPKEKGD